MALTSSVGRAAADTFLRNFGVVDYYRGSEILRMLGAYHLNIVDRIVTVNVGGSMGSLVIDLPPITTDVLPTSYEREVKNSPLSIAITSRALESRSNAATGSTPVYIAPALQDLLFQPGALGPAPAGIPSIIAGEDLASQLPLASRGIILRTTLIEAWFLYCHVQGLIDPSDRLQIRIDARINAVFNGTIPALFGKELTRVKEIINRRGEVKKVYITEKVSNTGNLNTVAVIHSYNPEWIPDFGEGQYLQISDFSTLAGINYVSSADQLGGDKLLEIVSRPEFAGTGIIQEGQISSERLAQYLDFDTAAIRAARDAYRFPRLGLATTRNLS